MDEKRKKSRRDRIEEGEHELAAKPSTRLLLERMAYDRRRVAQEQVRGERSLCGRLLRRAA
jgi:hypothetical protein